MSRPKTIRCSALPRIMACPASAATPEMVIDSTTPEARLGTAAHTAYEWVVEEAADAIDDGLIDDINAGTGYALDDGELRMLAWNGLVAWKKVRDRLENVRCEFEMHADLGDVLLSGHPDVTADVAGDEPVRLILDWKTGRKEAEPLDQLKGYCLLDDAVNGAPSNVRYLCMVVWTRLGLTETYEFLRDDLYKFADELCDKIARGQDRYNPDPFHCTYCPRQSDCPARKQLLASAGNDLLCIGEEGTSNQPMSPERLASLYPQSRMLKAALDRYEKQLREAVKAAGGTLGEMTLAKCERKAIRWDAKEIGLWVDDIAELHPTIGKLELEDAVKAAAPQGQKGARVKECLNELERCGLVTTTTYEALEYKPKKTTTEDK